MEVEGSGCGAGGGGRRLTFRSPCSLGATLAFARAWSLRSRPGYMSGYLAGAHALARTATSYPLGWAADRFGRKPVMVSSLFAVAGCSLAFGLSGSYAAAIAAR